MEQAVERGLDWVGLPVITTVARLPVTTTVARLLSPGVVEAWTVTPSRGGSRRRGWPGPSC